MAESRSGTSPPSLDATAPPPELGETMDDARPIEERAAVHQRFAVEGARGDRYALSRLLGEGGMGEVYECRDDDLERTVALKTVRGDRRSRYVEARFVREACVQAQLEHPSVVPVFDVGREVRISASAGDEGRPFFTMRKVSGITLDEILGSELEGSPAGFDRHRLLSAFLQICLTVQYAHSRGVLHRDIKPSNVMLGEFGEVYVLDWGLAKLGASVSTSPQPTAPRPSIESPELKTMIGAALGTPAYMAPEQFMGEVLDARADVFALGAMLFEILTLEPMLERAAIEERLRGAPIAWDARPSVRAPDRQVPPEFDRICARATAAQAANRYPSARALHDAVEAYLDGERDEELRRTVSASFLARAESLRHDDHDSALRHVHRAMALSDDPRALELFVDLVRNAPARTENEAERYVHEETAERRKRAQFLGAFLYLAPWLTVYPLVVARRGVWSWAEAIAPPLAWLLGTASLVLDRWYRTSERSSHPTFFIMLAVAVTSLLHGPLFTVPALATASVATHLLVTPLNMRSKTILYGCLAMVAPTVLLWTGLWKPYEFLGETAFRMRAVFHAIEPARFSLVLSTVDVMILVFGLAFVNSFRDQVERARAENVFFAWQLKKLLPSAAQAPLLGDSPPESGQSPSERHVARTRAEEDTEAEPLREVPPTTMTRQMDEALGEEAPAVFPLLTASGDRYVDREPLLAGPTTVLFRVRDRIAGRDVAMKRAHPDARTTLLAEARLRAHLAHPAVPPIYDAGVEADGAPWYTMKLVVGTSLAEALEHSRGTTQLHQHLQAFTQVCLAIDFAHRQGVAHGSLDPRHIVLGEFGEVYLLGWTHAKPLADHATDDIFALGAILSQMADAHADGKVPTSLAEICAKAMDRDVARRYHDAREVHDAVEAHLRRDRDEELRRTLAAERLVSAERAMASAATSEDARAGALRHIGRALALAPDRSVAIAALTRLLAMPPDKLPREVVEELKNQLWRLSEQTSRISAVTYALIFLAGLPIAAVVLGVRSSAKLAAVVTTWAIAAAVVRGQHVLLKRRRLDFPLAAIVAIVAVATTALLFGSYLIVPQLAITITMAHMLNVQHAWRRVILALGVASLAGPALLDYVNIIDVCKLPGGPSDHATFVIRGALYHPPWVFLVALTVANALNVVMIGFFAVRYRSLLDQLEHENRARALGLQRLL